MNTSSKNKTKAHGFNLAYDGTDMYYGWDVRPEFDDFFGDIKLKGLIALDLGAGEGRYAVYLARRGCAVTAVDFSDSGLKKLKAIADRHHLPVVTEFCDLSAYTFKGEAYDLIVAATILDHLETSVRNRVMEGMVRALKPGGLLYVNVFTVQDPGYRAADTVAQEGVSDTSFGIAHYFEAGELENCFSSLMKLYYYEGVEEDTSHGKPHNHGWASLIARKG